MLTLIRNFILGIMAIFRRLLCFLNIRRTRRDSGDTLLPLHHKSPSSGGTIGHGGGIASASQLQPLIGSDQHSSFMQESDEHYVGWDDWGSEKPACNGSAGPGSGHGPTGYGHSSGGGVRGVGTGLSSPRYPQHSNNHRGGPAQMTATPGEDPKIFEFFKEIEPKVSKTKKHYIGHDSPRLQASKFAVQENTTFSDPSAELGAWNENEGWDIDEHAVKVPTIGAVRLS